MKGNQKLPQLASGSKLKTQLPLTVYFNFLTQTHIDFINTETIRLQPIMSI